MFTQTWNANEPLFPRKHCDTVKLKLKWKLKIKK